MLTSKAVKLASTATPQTKTTTVFAFRTRPAIAPKGYLNGVFLVAVRNYGGEGDSAFDILHTELDVTDAKGAHHIVSKDYNVLPSGRGIGAFLQDYNAWSAAGLTEDDLYNEFDMDKMVKGKSVVVEVDHRKVGKDWQAYIKAFRPAGYTEPVAEATEVAPAA